MISDNKKLNSLKKVVIWLATQEQVQSSELKKILLPFDYFPGVLVDEINERSLELLDQKALAESNGFIIVYQEILSRIIPDLDTINSIDTTLDLEIDLRNSNKHEKFNQNTEDVIIHSEEPALHESSAGDDVYEEALNYYLPYGKYPQNGKEALRLLRKAGNLGCLDAYIDIADIYTDGGGFGDGSGIKQSYEKAIEYYIIGGSKGSIYCYYKMGILYALYKKDAINARKCFLIYAQKFQEKDTKSGLVISDENINTIASQVIQEIYAVLDNEYKALATPIWHDLIIEFSPVVRDAVIKNLEEGIASTSGGRRVSAALKYFKIYLQEAC